MPKSLLNLGGFPPLIIKKMKLTKSDKRYLRQVLEDRHQEDNGISIDKCPIEVCWFKRMLKRLELE